MIVTADDKAQSYNTSPTTCCVLPYFFGRAFCGGFEGAIRFDLPSKWWQGFFTVMRPESGFYMDESVSFT